MAKSITHLFSVYFQSFLSIDCGKTANMIVTEFPDALTVVVRQLEVRSACPIILQFYALQIIANLVTRRQKKKFCFKLSAVSMTHVNRNQTEVRDPLRKLLQGATLFLQTKIEHVIRAILSPIIFDFVLFSKKNIFSLGPVRDAVRVSERSLR